MQAVATEAACEPDDRSDLDAFLQTGRNYPEQVASDTFGDAPDAELPGIDFVTVE